MIRRPRPAGRRRTPSQATEGVWRIGRPQALGQVGDSDEPLRLPDLDPRHLRQVGRRSCGDFCRGPGPPANRSFSMPSNGASAKMSARFFGRRLRDRPGPSGDRPATGPHRAIRSVVIGIGELEIPDGPGEVRLRREVAGEVVGAVRADVDECPPRCRGSSVTALSLGLTSVLKHPLSLPLRYLEGIWPAPGCRQVHR